MTISDGAGLFLFTQARRDVLVCRIDHLNGIIIVMSIEIIVNKQMVALLSLMLFAEIIRLITFQLQLQSIKSPYCVHMPIKYVTNIFLS